MSRGLGLPVKCHLALAAQVAVGHVHSGDAGAAGEQLIRLPSLPLPWDGQFGRLWRGCGRGLGRLGRRLEEGTGEQSDEGLRYHGVHGK